MLRKGFFFLFFFFFFFLYFYAFQIYFSWTRHTYFFRKLFLVWNAKCEGTGCNWAQTSSERSKRECDYKAWIFRSQETKNESAYGTAWKSKTTKLVIFLLCSVSKLSFLYFSFDRCCDNDNHTCESMNYPKSIITV